MHIYLDLLVIIIALYTVKADVKHLSLKYLPPSINEIAQTERSLDEKPSPKIVNNYAENTASNQVEQLTTEAQDPNPFPGPFIPSQGGANGLGFPDVGGFQNFPGAVPNFQQQANFQGFPGAAGFQPGFIQPGFGQPGAFAQAGAFGQPGAFNQPFPGQQQFGNQGFPNFGGGFPGGVQAPQYCGPHLQQAGFPQQPFGAGLFPQPGFGFPNQFRQSDEVDTTYGSNGGYVYEKPSLK